MQTRRLGASLPVPCNTARCPECGLVVFLKDTVIGRILSPHAPEPGASRRYRASGGAVAAPPTVSTDPPCRGSNLLVTAGLPFCESCSTPILNPTQFCFMDRCCLWCDDTRRREAEERRSAPAEQVAGQPQYEDGPCTEAVEKLRLWSHVT